MQRFVAVVPVKPPATGKSRLVGLSDDARRALAEAFALDAVAACVTATAVEQVLVATDDAVFAARVGGPGVLAVPDGDTSGLNGVLVAAVGVARARWAHLTPVALVADLPALRADDLDAALGALVPGGASFVADAEGTGTTLYTAPYEDFAPGFGPDSARAHRLDGALAVPGVLDSLRADVDDLAALARAETLGVGEHTARCLATLRAAGAFPTSG